MGQIGGLSFDVFLDDHGMKRSMKDLRSTASMLKSEMRANFAELKSGGQVTEAYAGKVKDTERAIKAQKNIVDSAKKSQKGLDLTTADGRKEFSKQEKTINNANKAIVSLTGEQKRAKTSLEFYKSGMAEMNRTMKVATGASDAYVARLRAEGKENKANQAQLTGLHTKYSKLSDIYAKQAIELQKVAKETGESSEAYLKQKTRLDQTGKAMADTQAHVKTLNKSVGGLSVRMAGLADKGAKASKSFKTVGGRMVSLGKTASSATVAIGAGFAFGAKKAIELQNSFKQTTNLIKNGGETQKEAISGVSKMQRDATSDSIKYGKSQKSIADGYQDLVKRGYSSKQALGAMRSELQASVASGDDFSDVVGVSSQTLEAFGLRTKSTAGMIQNTKKVTNELAYAADLTSTGFSDLGVGMSYVGSTAHQAGFSLSETASAMGILSNNGLEADKAGTGLRKAINSLISPTKGGTAALKDMGLKTQDFIDKKGKMKSMTDIFGLLKSHTEGMSKTEKTNLFHSLFGTTGQQAGLILAESANKLGKLNDQVARSDKQHNGKGYVAVLANQNMKTAKNQLARFKKAGEAVAVMFAKNVLPYITKIAVKMAGMLDKLGKMSPKTQKLVVGFGLAAAAAGPVLTVIGGISKGIGASITGLKNMVNWYGKLNSKMTVQTDSRSVNNGTGIANQWKKSSKLGKVATGAAGAGVALSAGLDIYKAFKAKNPESKFKNAGKGIGTAIGGGIGLFFGGPLGAALGATIGKVIGGWGGKGAKLFTDGWNKKGKGAKPPKGLLPKAGYYARAGGDAIVGWGKGFARGVGKVIKNISGFNKKVGRTFGKVIKSIGRFNKRVGKAFRTVIKIIRNVLKPVKKVLEYALLIPIALVVGLAIKAWRKMRKPFKAVVGFIKKAVKSGWKFIKSITKSTWRAFKKYVINPVKAVWRVIDKYVVKTIVKAIRSAWKGIKHLTRSTWNAFKRYIVNPIKAVWSAVRKYIVKLIVKNVKNAWNDIKSITKSAWNLIKKYAVDPIVSVYDKVKSIMGKMKKVISSAMGSIKKVWHSAWSNVSGFFSRIWKSIKKHAKDGINAVIKVINAGISGIDGVIHAFGGKKHAIGRIGKVHFATGTGSLTSNFRRSIDRMTPAVVNDRPGASNPELIYRHATGNVEWMKGQNAETMLMPGDEVANDRDSALLAPKLGISHFASGGIGSFFGGIGSFVKGAISGAVSTVSKGAKWLKNLFKAATKIIGHPVKSLEELFKYRKSGKGIFKSLGKNMFGMIKGKAIDWWKSLWSMVDLNGSGITGGVAHTPGAGWRVSSGFGGRGAVSGGYSSHDGVDFSGARLVRAMMPGIVSGYGGAPSGWGGSNGIGEYVATHGLYNAIYQELNGKSNSGAKILVKKGETVKAGDPIAKLGPNASHVHVGVTKHPMFSIGGSGTAGWLDVTKLKSAGKSGKKSKGSDKTIRKQVGGGFWKLISKIAGLFGDASGSGDNATQPSGSHKDWLKEAGITNSFDKWNYIIKHESGWNPKATNGGSGAYGLPQSLPGSKMASAGSDWRSNPITQLKWMKSYVNSRYGGIGGAYRYWLSHHNYANGGFSSTAKLANISEGNLMESVIPLSKPSRAWELIGKSAAYLTKKNNSHTASANNNEGDSNAYMKQLVDQNSQLLKQISQFMSLVDAKPTGITPQAVYNANKQQTTIQTNRYNRSLGLS